MDKKLRSRLICVLCSLLHCALFILYCGVLNAAVTGVDEAGFYVNPVGFVVSLPLLCVFSFIQRKGFFLYTIPRKSPPLPPFPGGNAETCEPPDGQAAAFFRRFFRALDPVFDLAVYTLLFFLLTPGKIFPAAASLWGYFLPFLPAAALLLPFLLLLFLTDLLARYSAEKSLHLAGTDGEKSPGALNLRQLATRCLAAFLLWAVGGFILLALLLYVFSFLTLLFQGGQIFARSALFTLFLLTVAAILLLLPVYRLLRAVGKRKTFLRRLRRTVTQKGDDPLPLAIRETLYPHAAVKNPYRSIVAACPGESFRIISKGKIYSCKLLCSRKKTVPLELSPDGIGRRIHRFRIRRVTMFTYVRPFRFGFPEKDCDGRILIVLPTPKEILRREHGRVTPCDNGERVGDYRVFTGSAFLNALERDCLDR